LLERAPNSRIRANEPTIAFPGISLGNLLARFWLIQRIATIGVVLSITPAIAVELDVRAFGATGDGRTDDAPAIQKAVDTAIRLGPGNSVKFSNGTFRLAAQESHTKAQIT